MSLYYVSIFLDFSDPPTHYDSINTVLNVSKNGHWLALGPDPIPRYAAVPAQCPSSTNCSCLNRLAELLCWEETRLSWGKTLLIHHLALSSQGAWFAVRWNPIKTLKNISNNYVSLKSQVYFNAQPLRPARGWAGGRLMLHQPFSDPTKR